MELHLWDKCIETGRGSRGQDQSSRGSPFQSGELDQLSFSNRPTDIVSKPHIMPLIEVVPSPHTEPERTQFAIDYFKNLGSGHRPVRINKETQGFVGNRLAFALFREACHLVSNDVVSVEDLDTIVEASIAPRWAVAGPFKTYNSAGGIGGIGAFLHNLADTMEACWDDSGEVSLKGTSAAKQGTDADGDWTDKITTETEQAYGLPTAESLAERDRNLQKVIAAQPKGT
ncbi:hypothetical protein HZS61_016703 [Fusarium oxysporum f. sp. conglutinans]|uniref:3-hydroxyacyl-CoA dehydrogenase C-terminal domain-containing protein n=1 Tax=Fusarium oxysporum f. sp. conglutinans TaxID=100902 RepID=A0A8H6GMV0_FUSOX|nr:hypothetical protein HZS61_016703 [Fusarium oxysporum f. sp. conglutinans]